MEIQDPPAELLSRGEVADFDEEFLDTDDELDDDLEEI